MPLEKPLKVLVIAYFFPPQNAVGCFRTLRYLDEFSERGIEAQVLTVKDPNRRFHPYPGEMPSESSHKNMKVVHAKEIPTAWFWMWMTVLVRQIGKLFGKKLTDGQLTPRFWYIDLEFGWIPAALRAGRRMIKDFRPDVIYVSCPPFSSSVVAHKLAKQFDLPYVLDYRDSWLISAYTSDYQKQRYKKLDRKLLNDCAALCVTTPSDKKAYGAYFEKELGRSEDDVKLIFNGYEADFASSHASSPNEVLTILYAGAWDRNARSPRKLLEQLSAADFRWKLISVGSSNALLKAATQGLDLSKGELEYRDRVPKAELMPMFAEADVLFLIQGAPAPGQANTHIAAKTFDYLATGKAILGLTAPGDNRDFLADQATGIYLADANDDAHIAKTLRELHRDWSAGKLDNQERSEFLKNFSGPGLSAQLIDTLESALKP